jgi:hypothetical protein
MSVSGFDKYKGGLDTVHDLTGLYSVYTNWRSIEIMFHVSTQLPYERHDPQKVIHYCNYSTSPSTLMFSAFPSLKNKSISTPPLSQRGHAVATSYKPEGQGSIPDEFIGFFNLLNPSSRTMPLGSTQPLTEMSTRHLPVGKGRPERKADNLTAICEPIVLISQPYGPSRPVTGIVLRCLSTSVL